MLVFDVLLVGEAPSHRAVLESFPDDIVDTTVVSGADGAFEVLEAADPDCVVTDYDLPDSGGIDLLAVGGIAVTGIGQTLGIVDAVLRY